MLLWLWSHRPAEAEIHVFREGAVGLGPLLVKSAAELVKRRRRRRRESSSWPSSGETTEPLNADNAAD